MTAIPARVAGVRQLILVTPPGADGKVPAATLAAADIAGVDRIFCPAAMPTPEITPTLHDILCRSVPGVRGRWPRGTDWSPVDIIFNFNPKIV